MRISVTKLGGAGDLLTIEISPDMTIRDLKAIIESESDFGIQSNEMTLYHDGKVLHDESQTLEGSNIKDYDVVTCLDRPPTSNPNSPGASGPRSFFNQDEPQRLFNELRSRPELLPRLRQAEPELVQAIETNDINAFMQYLMSRMASGGARRPGHLDILDPTIQRRIEENINMENVRDNMEHAYEHAPEFFGHVVMLYINCEVNGHPIKAFVDSGAQMTIMSKACAERCGIMRLVDTRFSGIAKGVGTQKILGRVHMAQLEVEKQFFTTSLSVLEDQSMDMLIGLDMLRRHRCVIDLDRNVLRIENTVETSFLSESDLPLHARLTGNTPDTEQRDFSEAMLQSAGESADSRNQQQPNRPAAAAAAAAPPPTPSPFPEEAIKQITKKGFTREQAIEELKSTNGDITKALVTLMAKALGKPKQKK